MSDILSEILQHVRLTSSVYFQRDFHAPWSMQIGETGFAQFHVITHGSCYVTCNGEFYECLTGDILLFPNGLEHVLADSPAKEGINGQEVMASFSSDMPMFAEGGLATRLICGHYAYQLNSIHPLMKELPAVIHVKAANVLGEASDIPVLPLILKELASENPGQSLIVERLAEILLVQTLRLFYAQSPQGPGFYSGLTNQRLARAIFHIHREFSSQLSLADLAKAAAMSRSSFAGKFKQTTQITPIAYLAKWRMVNAGNYLKTTDDPVAIVAERVGYLSEISFARAFKREYGVSPAVFRKTA